MHGKRRWEPVHHCQIEEMAERELNTFCIAPYKSRYLLKSKQWDNSASHLVAPATHPVGPLRQRLWIPPRLGKGICDGVPGLEFRLGNKAIYGGV